MKQFVFSALVEPVFRWLLSPFDDMIRHDVREDRYIVTDRNGN